MKKESTKNKEKKTKEKKSKPVKKQEQVQKVSRRVVYRGKRVNNLPNRVKKPKPRLPRDIKPLSIACLTSALISLLFAPHQLTAFTKLTLPFSTATALVGIITFSESYKKKEPDNYLRLAGLIISIVSLVTCIFGLALFHSLFGF